MLPSLALCAALALKEVLHWRERRAFRSENARLVAALLARTPEQAVAVLQDRPKREPKAPKPLPLGL